MATAKFSRDVERIADDVDSLTLTRMIMTHTKDPDLALLLQSIQVKAVLALVAWDDVLMHGVMMLYLVL